MDYKQQNDDLLVNFLNRTFFHSWKMSPENRKNTSFQNYSSLELELNPLCSTNCKYCYLAKYGKELMPVKSWNKKQIIGNLGYILEWLKKEKLNPNLEIFSGDPLVQNTGYEMIEKIYNWYDGKDRINLLIPSNMDFLHYPDKTQKILDYYEKFDKKNIDFVISASVDGLFLEENRPHRSSVLKYDDVFYDKLFTFTKQTGTGFHPMIYSEGIEKWPENFLWFQKMFKKYQIPFQSIYLLEVRNANWTIHQCQELEKFMNFLVKWTWDHFNHSEEEMLNFLFKGKGFNILTNGLSTIGRGIGCSIQSTMMLRLGDLKFVPCHRTSYDFMESGEFIVKDGKIDHISSINPSLLFTINGINISSLPGCNNCAIAQFCSGGCLGSQYETTGDLFSPIPTVCRMMHYKFRGLFRAYEEIGIMPKILNLIDKNKVEAYKFCIKEQIL